VKITYKVRGPAPTLVLEPENPAESAILEMFQSACSVGGARVFVGNKTVNGLAEFTDSVEIEPCPPKKKK